MTEIAQRATDRASEYDESCMKVLRAKVRAGRLVMDEPTDLPEGAEVEVLVLPDDELDPEERTRLLQAIEEGARDFERGAHMDADEFLAQLRARHASPHR
jgi:hypothetical protein